MRNFGFLVSLVLLSLFIGCGSADETTSRGGLVVIPDGHGGTTQLDCGLAQNVRNTACGSFDFDQDGFNNGYEIIKGTNPTDPTSFPQPQDLPPQTCTGLHSICKPPM